jgi:UDP-N-acetylglucosamine diphosphorylase/glucosamine-1-phosphate N-acetyltransferase
MKSKKAAIILAAGKGKRMKSDLPKVLHKIKGKPLIRYLAETMSEIGFDRQIAVVGYKGQMVIDELRDTDLEFIWQEKQLGTGHAVQMTRDILAEFNGTVLVAAGDVPFLTVGTIRKLLETHRRNEATATCLSAIFDDPAGYGRIIRKHGTDILLDIVEDIDASDEIRQIREINSGTFCFECRDMFIALEKIDRDNIQEEYYLTDTIKILQKMSKRCAVSLAENSFEIMGVNSEEQLKLLEQKLSEKNE